MWMKKKYVLNFDNKKHGSVVAHHLDQTHISVDEGELMPITSRQVLQGKAISIRQGERMHLVHITGLDSKGNLAVTMNGRPVSVNVMDELRSQAMESLGDAAGSGTICADIPGLVVEIKVETGQTVHQGDPIVVVEAMKMQNELCAAVAGTVVSIPVEPGQAVNPGDTLIVIDPEPGG